MISDGKLDANVGVGQEDGELLTAVAADQVGAADAAEEAFGDDPDDVVAGGVAVRVVDPLEVIDVDHHGDGGPVVLRGDRQVTIGHLEEMPAVRDAGQLVGNGKLLDLRERPGVGIRGHTLSDQGSGDVDVPFAVAPATMESPIG